MIKIIFLKNYSTHKIQCIHSKVPVLNYKDIMKILRSITEKCVTLASHLSTVLNEVSDTSQKIRIEKDST